VFSKIEKELLKKLEIQDLSTTPYIQPQIYKCLDGKRQEVDKMELVRLVLKTNTEKSELKKSYFTALKETDSEISFFQNAEGRKKVSKKFVNLIQNKSNNFEINLELWTQKENESVAINQLLQKEEYTYISMQQSMMLLEKNIMTGAY